MWNKILNWIHELTAGTGLEEKTQIRTAEESQLEDKEIDLSTQSPERDSYDERVTE